MLSLSLNEFEDTKEVISIHKSKKDRQYNGKTMVKRTNDDLLNTTQKTTRGAVHCDCVAHLSFCFEETSYTTFHTCRCFLTSFGSLG